jgi:CheY-like chemotaxis protein
MPEQLLILHVEDDLDDAELFQDAFKDNGQPVLFEVLNAGDKVLPWLEKELRLPDIIVMDLNLPKMHGKEVLVRIKANQRFQTIPLIVLTTSSSLDDLEYCQKNGADKFISKPYTVNGFKLMVDSIMSLIDSVKSPNFSG